MLVKGRWVLHPGWSTGGGCCTRAGQTEVGAAPWAGQGKWVLRPGLVKHARAPFLAKHVATSEQKAAHAAVATAARRPAAREPTTGACPPRGLPACLQVIVGLQTDEPLKRAIKPLGGVGVVKSALEGEGRLLPLPLKPPAAACMPAAAVGCWLTASCTLPCSLWLHSGPRGRAHLHPRAQDTQPG